MAYSNRKNYFTRGRDRDLGTRSIWEDMFGTVGNEAWERQGGGYANAWDLWGGATKRGGFLDPQGAFRQKIGSFFGGGGSQSAVKSAPTDKTGAGANQSPSWLQQNQGKVALGGALLGGITGYKQAKQQKEGLGVAIEELDPLKGQFMGEHERQKGLAEAYRPGGKYSRYMAGQMYSQAAESVGQESQRMIASGITSPSMMRAMGRQSRRQTQAAMPGMELQLSQMALPYEKLAAGSMTQYGGVVEQLASLKGARASIDPLASAISGASEGMMAAGNMMSSFFSPV